MIATVTLTVFQDTDIYTVAALAEVLGTPRLLGGAWFFEHQVCEEPVHFDDDEESIALNHWLKNQCRDIEALLGQEFADMVSCEAEFSYHLEEWEREERRAYERDLHRGRVWA
jgi:hypothetical protein